MQLVIHALMHVGPARTNRQFLVFSVTRFKLNPDSLIQPRDPRTTDLREVLNSILYMARTGCQWRMLPKEFPPRSTIQLYFYAWRSDETSRALNHHLLMAAREARLAHQPDRRRAHRCLSLAAPKSLSDRGRDTCMGNRSSMSAPDPNTKFMTPA